jgi:hypothetical protein
MMMLPKQLQRMLEGMEAGEGNLSMTMKGLDEPTRRITAAANRLVMALLAVAFILGPALIIPRLHEIFPRFQLGAIVLVLLGFGLSALITLVLLLSVWRSGR